MAVEMILCFAAVSDGSLLDRQPLVPKAVRTLFRVQEKWEGFHIWVSFQIGDFFFDLCVSTFALKLGMHTSTRSSFAAQNHHWIKGCNCFLQERALLVVFYPTTDVVGE